MKEIYDIVNSGKIDEVFDDPSLFQRKVPVNSDAKKIKELDDWGLEIVDCEVDVKIDNKDERINKWIALKGKYKGSYIRTSVVIATTKSGLIKTAYGFYKLLTRSEYDYKYFLPNGFVIGWETETFNYIKSHVDLQKVKIINNVDELAIDVEKINPTNLMMDKLFKEHSEKDIQQISHVTSNNFDLSMKEEKNKEDIENSAPSDTEIENSSGLIINDSKMLKENGEFKVSLKFSNLKENNRQIHSDDIDNKNCENDSVEISKNNVAAELFGNESSHLNIDKQLNNKDVILENNSMPFVSDLSKFASISSRSLLQRPSNSPSDKFRNVKSIDEDENSKIIENKNYEKSSSYSRDDIKKTNEIFQCNKEFSDPYNNYIFRLYVPCMDPNADEFEYLRNNWKSFPFIKFYKQSTGSKMSAEEEDRFKEFNKNFLSFLNRNESSSKVEAMNSVNAESNIEDSLFVHTKELLKQPDCGMENLFSDGKSSVDGQHDTLYNKATDAKTSDISNNAIETKEELIENKNIIYDNIVLHSDQDMANKAYKHLIVESDDFEKQNASTVNRNELSEKSQTNSFTVYNDAETQTKDSPRVSHLSSSPRRSKPRRKICSYKSYLNSKKKKK